MLDVTDRWVLPDLRSALNWCEKRNAQGIGCTLDILGEYVKTPQAVEKTTRAILICAHALEKNGLDAGLAVKLTSLGALFDSALSRKNLFHIFQETEELNVNIELDMEGTPLVDHTIDTALECSDKGYHVTLALQAYLDRTPSDIKRVLDHDITVRLVKGAYLGDTDDFAETQQRFDSCVDLLSESERHFSVATHDPEIIKRVKTNASEQKDLVEFGLLKGLGDQTKLDLAGDGWAVAEYVPFGADSRAYIKRRERYLENLTKIGREPIQ